MRMQIDVTMRRRSMLDLQTIVVPVDASSGSEAALHLGVHLASRRKAKVRAVYVSDSNTSDITDTSSYLQNRVAQVERPDVDVSLEVLKGSVPGQVLAGYTSDVDADAIVMGKHGVRTTDRLLTYLGAYGQVLGGTAEYLVRTASCPVLLTSPRFVHGSSDIRRILIAIDFSAFTPAAIRLGRELAELFEAEVEYLHVRTEGSTQPVAGHDNNVREMNDFVIEEGPADRVILDRVRDRSVDLLMIHSHGKTGDQRMRIGHVAEKLVRSAPCSVLTIKSFGKAPVRAEGLDRDLAIQMSRRAAVLDFHA